MESPVEELEKTWELCQQINFSPGSQRLVSDLLEPTASLLCAETAVFRVFSPGDPRPVIIAGLGIGDSVHDAYLNRYFKLDPTRRLLARRFAKPIFADQTKPGIWSDEHVATTGETCPCTSPPRFILSQHLHEFHRYKREFLLPNNFYHHVGIRFQDTSGNHTFALDYNRPKELPPFGRLEFARAKVVTMLFQARAVQLSAAISCPESAVGHRSNGISDEHCPYVDSAYCTKGFVRRLSARELEVAETVALGLTNKEVSEALNISIRTVENHIRSIFAKLEVNTRTRIAAKLHEVKSYAQ